jgi:hypothetical protein
MILADIGRKSGGNPDKHTPALAKKVYLVQGMPLDDIHASQDHLKAIQLNRAIRVNGPRI